MVWQLAAVAGRGAAGLRLRLGPLLGRPLGPAAPLAPRFLLLLRPSPMHAQVSFLGTGGSGGGSSRSSSSGGGGGGGGGGGSSSPSSSSSSSLVDSSNSGSAGPQDLKKTERALRDSSVLEESKQSKQQQLKKVFKEYGAVAVSLHIGISLISLGIFYLVVSSGVDVSSFLFKLGFAESLHNSKIVAGTSTFVVAYAIHKLFAPVRISITLFSLPLVVRYFRKVGFFKAPGSKP
ncbi:protein FAM210B, mitochondrial [Trichosurus vulpecula]|uniref:protein FAM210B, mitochondrial n=1 Tax=Trichosurus vulpecula TaxID=9337 RepID=UPI00186B444D|nr:protein FAM210B, mitochondrial [Trichosurus vulpecula]